MICGRRFSFTTIASIDFWSDLQLIFWNFNACILPSIIRHTVVYAVWYGVWFLMVWPWFGHSSLNLNEHAVWHAVSRMKIERMRAPVRHISYGIRHTALCHMYGIVAYVRHNNHAGSPVLGIPALPHWHESSQLQIKLSYAWNQHTYPFLWFKTHGCEKLIGNINVCINQSKDLPTDMPERTTTLFILKWPCCTKRNMVTGEFKAGAQWKIYITFEEQLLYSCYMPWLNAN